MFCKKSFCCLTTSFLGIGILVILCLTHLNNMEKYVCYIKKIWHQYSIPQIHIAIVVCGTDDRVEETIVNIKSALLFTQQPVMIHIFTEDNLKAKFIYSFSNYSLEKWPWTVKSRFQYQLYSIQYPNDGNAVEWKKLFKVCASQRLFLPLILDKVELLLYVDTDVLFLSSVENIWNFFMQFNSTQLSAMAPEQEQTNIAWYSRFARHPFYGSTGINSGVMLMNMSRIRNKKFKNDLQNQAMTWQEMLLPLYKKYKLNITWGDQDLLNIIFHHNPEMLLTFPCRWNYRPDHCMYMPVCKSAVDDGVKVLHGCRRAFHIDKWPTFKAVYLAIKSFEFGRDQASLLKVLNEYLSDTPETGCKKSINSVLKGLQNTVNVKHEL